MTLIKSISGIRGTIGGKVGDNLTPLDLVKFTSAYATILKESDLTNRKVVIGRDGRLSGNMVKSIVSGTFVSMGFEVIDIDYASTPTTEVAVVLEKAIGGVILTASHNPKHWNALKLLNEKGEFISAELGQRVLELAEKEQFEFNQIDEIGSIVEREYTQKHIEEVKKLKLVDVETIKKAGFKVAYDGINSVGGFGIAMLLKELGVSLVYGINIESNGIFAHNPEPLPENITELIDVVKKNKADVGFVVDPDVDRLAIIDEKGGMFGEEYTLVSIADYILSNTKGNTVSNLSSTRALRDVTVKHGGSYSAAAVGEVNVVEKMKATKAVIGGEGNGGIIYPKSHYGRDAFVGIALFLTQLAKSKMTCSQLRSQYPNYFMSKNKIELKPNVDVDSLLKKIEAEYKAKSGVEVNTIDGVKIDFADGWVHLRKSNTEPIVRIYSESTSPEKAGGLAQEIIRKVKTLL